MQLMGATFMMNRRWLGASSILKYCRILWGTLDCKAASAHWWAWRGLYHNLHWDDPTPSRKYLSEVLDVVFLRCKNNSTLLFLPVPSLLGLSESIIQIEAKIKDYFCIQNVHAQNPNLYQIFFLRSIRESLVSSTEMSFKPLNSKQLTLFQVPLLFSK